MAKIIIISAPLSTSIEDVKLTCKKLELKLDNKISEATKKHVNKIKDEGREIFGVAGNIIVAEDGYNIIMYESDFTKHAVKI